MSVWNKCKDKMPPLNEDVLILFKDKKDKLTYENLYYGIAKRYIHKPFPSSEGWEDWSHFTEYQGYYEVVFWTPLIDMPMIEGSDSK
jgi:hypothetical protein